MGSCLSRTDVDGCVTFLVVVEGFGLVCFGMDFGTGEVGFGIGDLLLLLLLGLLLLLLLGFLRQSRLGRGSGCFGMEAGVMGESRGLVVGFWEGRSFLGCIKREWMREGGRKGTPVAIGEPKGEGKGECKACGGGVKAGVGRVGEGPEP